MFNNLIESSSHKQEFRRRTSFMAGTLAAYTFMFLAAGLVSIYAYDTHLESQEVQIVRLMTPVLAAAAQPDRPHDQRPSSPSTGSHSTPDIRVTSFDDISHSRTPEKISTEANNVQPVRPGKLTLPGATNTNGADASVFIGPGSGLGGNDRIGGSGSGDTGIVHIDDLPPAKPPSRHANTPATKTLQVSVLLNSRAVQLPIPPYPELARRAGASGNVPVQVLIDETGRVLSAHAVSGHPFLQRAAEQAAFRARFTPTILGGVAMRVSGLINYNFKLQ